MPLLVHRPIMLVRCRLLVVLLLLQAVAPGVWPALAVGESRAFERFAICSGAGLRGTALPVQRTEELPTDDRMPSSAHCVLCVGGGHLAGPPPAVGFSRQIAATTGFENLPPWRDPDNQRWLFENPRAPPLPV